MGVVAYGFDSVFISVGPGPHAALLNITDSTVFDSNWIPLLSIGLLCLEWMQTIMNATVAIVTSAMQFTVMPTRLMNRQDLENNDRLHSGYDIVLKTVTKYKGKGQFATTRII